MFGKVAAFELRYQLRQPVFWVVAAVFFLLSFAAMVFEEFSFGAGGQVNRNGPFPVTIITTIWTIFYMLVTTAFVANVIVRDDQTGYGPLVRATPIGKVDYLFGRFAGAFAAVLLCFLAIPLGLIAGSLAPWLDPEVTGPLRLGDYAYSYAVMAVPGLLLTSSLFFATATVTRSMMGAYLAAVALLVLYLITGPMLGRLESKPLAALLDPFGLRAVSLATEYWTAAERNTRNVALAGPLLFNRLLAVGLSAAFLALAYALFRFDARGKPARKAEKLQARVRAEAPAPVHAGPLPQPAFGRATDLAVLLKRTRFEVGQVVKSPAFVVLMALAVAFTGMVLWSTAEIRGTPIYPVTRLMIEGVRGGMGLFVFIVAIFHSGELVWRERERRIHEITDSSAAPDWAFVIPKILGLIVVLVAISVAGVFTAMAVQTLKGWRDYEVGQYLAWFLLPNAIDVALLAVLAVFVQALSPNKFAGWAVMVVYYILTSIAAGALGFDHKLYLYGESPGVPLSEMNGQGRFGVYAAWFRAYWSAFAVVLVVLAYGLWRRGTETRLKPRLQRLPARLAGGPGLVAAAALVAFVGLGGWIFLNTVVWNTYRSNVGWDRYSARYERELWRYSTTPQPSITSVTLDADLEPKATRLTTRGRYVLENRTRAPLREVHLRALSSDLEVRAMNVEGARLTRDFPDYRYRIFTFERPMAPGEQRTVTWTTILGQRGFRNSRNMTEIVENGTFVNALMFAPVVGMDRRGLLDDRNTRRRMGLTSDMRRPKLEDRSAQRFNELRTDWVLSDITLTTDADQTPMAPGYKVSERVTDGRRTARFVSEAPIHNFFAIQSARYAMTRERHAGVDMAVYHDNRHGRNVPSMMTAMKTALGYYTAAYGPYQFRQARIVEFPAYELFAQAFANTMPYSEGYGFITDFRNPDEINFVSYTTAHEMAHQWWAHQLVGADMQGSTLLTETLASYSALMVAERLYGPEQVRKFLKYELDSYLHDRGSDPNGELPLIRMEGQPYLHYRKGAVVMYLLKEEIGEEAVNRALRRMLAQHRFTKGPYPRSLDLVAAFRAEAGPQHQALITDLFERITLYDLEARAPVVRRRPDGRYDVSFTVEARKLYADGEGNERATPLGEAIEVGLFAVEPGKRGFDKADVIAVEKRPIRSGVQTVTLVAARAPRFVGVDPYNKRIDRDSSDNLVRVAS